MTNSVITCLLVAALCLAIGGETTAAVVIAGVCALISFFLPLLALPIEVPDEEPDFT